MRTLRTLPALLLAAAGCSESTGIANRGPTPASGIVVLNGSQATGLTLRSVDGRDSAFVAFTPSSAFDGGAMALHADTVVSTSSKWTGDQLWVATLADGSVRRIQLPALSNPAAAQFVSHAQGRVAVALRDSQAVAVVRLAGTPEVTMLRGAGTCPEDVAGHNGDLWVLDSNADCRGDYSVLGPARLIRIRAGSTVRDTVVLPDAARGTGGSLTIVGSTAYVSTGGEATFGATTVFTRPPMVVRVDLVGREVRASRALPAGTYLGSLRRGADQNLYLSAYASTDFATRAVFSLDPQTLAFNGPFAAGTQRLDLRKAGGEAPNCGSATADAAGNVYCIETDYVAAGATTVYVFDELGAPVKALAAGQYGVDLALR